MTLTTPTTPCILVKANSDKGYRRVRVNGKMVNAARIALESNLGRPLRLGMVPDHLCRARNCVNPEHLEEVTLAENTRRGISNNLTPDQPCPNGHVGHFRPYPRGRRCLDCRHERYLVVEKK